MTISTRSRRLPEDLDAMDQILAAFRPDLFAGKTAAMSSAASEAVAGGARHG